MYFDISSYNIRGLNNKQTFAKDFISLNKLSLCAFLETHVNSDNASSISRFICPRFNWIFNYEHHSNGRIWVGFDPSLWQVDVISTSAQQITCMVLYLSSGVEFVLSFVYGHNTTLQRRELWNDLLFIHNNHTQDHKAWCLTGDFNICLGPDESSNSDHWTRSMMDFQDFILQAAITDLKSSGSLFTWWDSNSSSPLFRKLDRCMVNGKWLHDFSLSYSHVLARGLSDHCPIAISIGLSQEKIGKPFQFFNHLIHNPIFLETVKLAWQERVTGNPWFVLTTKLKKVKMAIRSLNVSTGNLHNMVTTSRDALLLYQERMPPMPTTPHFEEEARLVQDYHRALKLEEIFLKQKSRVSWLKNGDSNNKFFFNACKGRWNLNKILLLEDDDGTIFTSHKDISKVAVDFYQKLLGQPALVSDIPEDIHLPQLTDFQREELVKPFDNADVWNALKSMAKGKCPGPDGLTVEFFIAAWSVISEEVCKGVLYFFDSLHLPRIINSTALALIPKVQSASRMSDFRPIACCNILYKCITKMLAARLKKIIHLLISPSQSAFVPKRLIGDNILLAQALFRNYHLNSDPARCAFKIDLKKAFDTLHWGFLKSSLQKMGFPLTFVNWVMSCIGSCMISIKVNGSLEGYFQAGSGLRQGDPLSPYLFVIAMEVFSAFMKKATEKPGFQFHWKTKELGISHLIFADDVMLFCHGHITSINLVLDAVHEFSSVSGLHTNKDKSQCFLANVDDNTRSHAIAKSGFQLGRLPIKYLGLPLITTKLTSRDCTPLIMNLSSRIDSWVNKSLNHAGRLQLIKVVLFGIQGYWSSHLSLPKFALKKIQSLFVNYLWSGSCTSVKQVKVSWHECCYPKSEGGLGLRDLCDWNRATFLFHLWRILQPNNNSLWITWFKRVYLKRKALWTMEIPSKTPWCIRKILQVRPLALRYIRYLVGANSSFYFWNDPWLDNKPLLSRFHASIVSIADSSKWAVVADFIHDNRWTLPLSNHTMIMELRDLVSLVNIHSHDSIQWGNTPAKFVSASLIWNTIRSYSSTLPWTNAVWHILSIPKCSFTFWLALKDRLLTKERMVRFGLGTDSGCVLCDNAVETNSHIFSTCSFFQSIISDPSFSFTRDWNQFLAGEFITGGASKMKKNLSYLFLSVAIYCTWKERNDRMHKVGHKQTPTQLRFFVKRMVREKVSSNTSFQKAAVKDPTLMLALY